MTEGAFQGSKVMIARMLKAIRRIMSEQWLLMGVGGSDKDGNKNDDKVVNSMITVPKSE